MSDDELDAITELLEDDYARSILRETSEEPLSAEELSDRCDMSPPTVYRRLNRLAEHDLVTVTREVDSSGHHYKMYEARLSRVTIDLESGEFEVTIERTQDAADRFTELVEELQ
jgi:DNA-binding transcriptional ArsR family regulator